MDFVTVRELRAGAAKVWEKIEAGEEIVITRNGKPFALLVHTAPDQVEQKLKALRAERFAAALDQARQEAAKLGLDTMNMEEIDAEIALARKERRERAQGSR